VNIGVIADTHDNLPKIEKAVRFFNRRRVEFVLHAGDFIAPFAAVRFKALSCEFRGVFGNNDGERQGLNKISDGKIQAGPLRVSLDNRRILVVHDINSVDLTTENIDLIIFGHTHKPEIRHSNSSLLVNPGECSGWLSSHASIAIVDLKTFSSRIFYL